MPSVYFTRWYILLGSISVATILASIFYHLGGKKIFTLLGSMDGLDAALNCKLRKPLDILWGYVVSIRYSKITIIHGYNRSITVTKPSSGAYSKVELGCSVAILKKTKLFPDGTTKSPALSTSQMRMYYLPSSSCPCRLKASVLSFDAETRKGRAIVQLTGTTPSFTLTADPVGRPTTTAPIGATFTFIPKFDGEGVLAIPQLDAGAVFPPLSITSLRVNTSTILLTWLLAITTPVKRYNLILH